MTERYGFVDLGETWCISVDGECKYYMHLVDDCKRVVDLLNEQRDKLKRIEKEVNNCNIYRDDLKDIILEIRCILNGDV